MAQSPCFKTPKEPDADRGQFHSKVVLIEYEGDARCIVVGSHNWTANALQGFNLEAGMIVRCGESDVIVSDTRKHIEACVRGRGTEVFDPNRMRFYQAVQRDLQPTFSGPPSELFPGFIEDDAVVIHAESADSKAVPNTLRVFIPSKSWMPMRFFADDRVLSASVQYL
jgi:hypothetical protein